MNNESPSVIKYTRRGLFKLWLVTIAVLGALEYYWRHEEGFWNPTSLIFIPIVVWIMSVISFRWLKIAEEQVNGTFDEDKYKENPQAYLWGTKRLKRVTFAVAFTIVAIYAIIRAFYNIRA